MSDELRQFAAPNNGQTLLYPPNDNSAPIINVKIVAKYLLVINLLNEVSLWSLVINSVGNNIFPLTWKPVNAGRFIAGFATMIPKTAPTIIAINKNVLK